MRPLVELAFLYQKKHIPLAVVRNRVRRQVKELFRTSDCLARSEDLVIRATKENYES